MGAQVPTDTSTEDIAVRIQEVWKSFRQRQRTENMRDVFRNLFAPRFRTVNALKGVSLNIRRGEIVAYAGPNGAGKSTTVKLLSGMLSPERGTVEVLGMNPVRDRVRYMKRIGIVFGQRTELWWDHPISASFKWKKVVWDIPHERFERMQGFVKELLGLNEFFNTMARELSLGQRMRADLGLALLHEPDVLFLDEPSLGLDVLGKRQMTSFISDLNLERKVTVMVTSHDMAELEQMAGRIVMIHQGEIAFDGDFQTLRTSFTDTRFLRLYTNNTIAPTLTGATWVASEGQQHEFTFDAAKVTIAELLSEASAQTQLLDIETHRDTIDSVIAAIYTRWQQEHPLEVSKT